MWSAARTTPTRSPSLGSGRLGSCAQTHEGTSRLAQARPRRLSAHRRASATDHVRRVISKFGPIERVPVPIYFFGNREIASVGACERDEGLRVPCSTAELLAHGIFAQIHRGPEGEDEGPRIPCSAAKRLAPMRVEYLGPRDWFWTEGFHAGDSPPSRC